MLNMPVATLRNWERRYGVTQPTLSPGGQRLYSAEDVRRLVLIRRLTELGHAIGSLAALDMQALQGVAATHANALASRHEAEPLKAAPAAPHRAWRLAVIGTGLAARLQRPALLRRLGLPLQLLGPFDDAAQAAAALRDAEPDAVLIHLPHLNEDCLTAIDVLAPSLAAAPKALLFSFAADAVCEDLASAGVALLREPQPDAVLAQWLRNLAGAAAAPPPPGANPIARATEAISPRRWTEEALREFAGRPLTMGCECPRHVAELLMQLAHFEAYSAECEQRNAADADLHAYLGRVAAASRARFEVALEHLAVHEGLLLPPPALSSQA